MAVLISVQFDCDPFQPIRAMINSEPQTFTMNKKHPLVIEFLIYKKIPFEINKFTSMNSIWFTSTMWDFSILLSFFCARLRSFSCCLCCYSKIECKVRWWLLKKDVFSLVFVNLIESYLPYGCFRLCLILWKWYLRFPILMSWSVVNNDMSIN